MSQRRDGRSREEEKKRSGRETAGLVRRFIHYYKPHKKLFLLDMGASVLVALIGVVYPIITRTMLNTLIPERNYRMIVLLGVTLLSLYFAKMLLNYFIRYKGHMMGVYMQAQMRSDMFDHLEKLPYSFYDHHETGKIMSRMTNDLFDVSELAHHGPENLIISVLSIVISFAYLMSINVWLTLIVFACVPFLVIISWSLRTKMRRAFRDTRSAMARSTPAWRTASAGSGLPKPSQTQRRRGRSLRKGTGSSKSPARIPTAPWDASTAATPSSRMCSMSSS